MCFQSFFLIIVFLKLKQKSIIVILLSFYNFLYKNIFLKIWYDTF